MTAYKTISAILDPDGKINIPKEELPDHSIKVMITYLENLLSKNETDSLIDVGDYLSNLETYEDNLAKGEIRWK